MTRSATNEEEKTVVIMQRLRECERWYNTRGVNLWTIRPIKRIIKKKIILEISGVNYKIGAEGLF